MTNEIHYSELNDAQRERLAQCLEELRARWGALIHEQIKLVVRRPPNEAPYVVAVWRDDLSEDNSLFVL